MSHRSAAQPAPPVALSIGGNNRADLLLVIKVEAPHPNVVGVTVGGLHLVNIKTGREKKHRLAPSPFQRVVNVGGNAAGPGQRAEHRRFQHGKIAVASAHPERRLHPARVAVVRGKNAVLYRLNAEFVPGWHKPAAFGPVAGAVAEHA